MEAAKLQQFVREFVRTYKQTQTELFSHNPSVFDMALSSQGVVLGVLILLVAMSIGCWFIIAYKWFYLSRAQRQSRKFLDLFWASKRLESIYGQSESFRHSPLSQVFNAGYVELRKLKSQEQGSETEMFGGGIENVDRALRRTIAAEETHLENLVSFLATVGSAAPFIGLFGTVWGIMSAFHHIDENAKSVLTTVTPYIAEALVATAVGLFAAIPAVMAYNTFVNRIRVLSTEMTNFSHDFLNILKRNFFRN